MKVPSLHQSEISTGGRLTNHSSPRLPRHLVGGAEGDPVRGRQLRARAGALGPALARIRRGQPDKQEKFVTIFSFIFAIFLSVCAIEDD